MGHPAFCVQYLFAISTKVSLEDKALCPKLTFWERRVCLYDQV